MAQHIKPLPRTLISHIEYQVGQLLTWESLAPGLGWPRLGCCGRLESEQSMEDLSFRHSSFQRNKQFFKTIN